MCQYVVNLKQKRQQIGDFEKLWATKASALQQARKKANKIPDAAQREHYINKITASEQQIKIKTANTKKKKQLVKLKIARLLATSRLKVNELMHPGVELKIAQESKQFSRIYPPSLMRYLEGKITQTF